MVQQLVALGAIRGEVLDPGTGPGHHAIYYAAKGYAATGIDGSVAAIEKPWLVGGRVHAPFWEVHATRVD